MVEEWEELCELLGVTGYKNVRLEASWRVFAVVGLVVQSLGLVKDTHLVGVQACRSRTHGGRVRVRGNAAAERMGQGYF